MEDRTHTFCTDSVVYGHLLQWSPDWRQNAVQKNIDKLNRLETWLNLKKKYRQGAHVETNYSTFVGLLPAVQWWANIV